MVRCPAAVQMQTPHQETGGAFVLWGPGDDLLSHGQSAISSARRRFTVLFGMGRGGANALWSPGILEWEGRYWILYCTVFMACLAMARDAQGYRVKPHGQLVLVSARVAPLTHPAYQRRSLRRPFRGIKSPGDLIFRQVSRLDAFSGYLFRI